MKDKMRKTGKQFSKLCGLALVLLAVQGCGMTEKIFNSAPEERMEGERLTVLELQAQLEPDPALARSEMTLPEMRENRFWPQYGGYPNHAMTHLALNTELEQAWRADIGDGGGNERPIFMPPVVADGKVFTLDAGLQVSAFDAETGRRMWRAELPVDEHMQDGALGGGLAYDGGRLYVTAGLNQAFVLTADTGEAVEILSLTAAARSAPAVHDGQLYIQTLDNRITVYNTDDFEQVWGHTGLSETTSLLGSASPAVDRDMMISAFSTGEVVAFRNLNGQTLWMDNLSSLQSSRGISTISDIRAPVVIDRGLAYAISYGGRMAAIDTLTGQRVWQKQLGGTQMPWSAGNVVYVMTSDQQLVALSRVDGGIYWVQPLSRTFKKDEPLIWHGPVLAGGRLLTVSNHGQVIELDPVQGEILAEWEIRGKAATAPVIADKTLYIVTTGGDLIAYR